MTQFTIFGKNLTPEEIEKVKGLVDEVVCTGDLIFLTNSIGAPHPDIEADILVVLGTGAMCAGGDLESDLKKAANGARRTIWIWPESAVPANVPPAAAKYSYSIVSWSAEKLRNVAADDDLTIFETPGGEPLPVVETDRNLCVEEKANLK